MELYLSVLEDFLLFLKEWPQHTIPIAFAVTIWDGIIRGLLKTRHASLDAKGSSCDIACGDKRVHRDFVIFGGPAALTFGFPYFLVMNFLPTGGFLQEILREYWSGFIYLQFLTSVVQTMVFFGYALKGKKPDKIWRLFKSHWKGCGWVSASSALGWIAYKLQKILPNRLTFLMWVPRDVETTIVFAFNLVFGPVILVCLIASLLNSRIIIPWISWIDKDYEDDEDSSSEKT